MVLAAMVCGLGIAGAYTVRDTLRHPGPVLPDWRLFGAIYVTHPAAMAAWFAGAAVVTLVWLAVPTLAPWILRAPPSTEDPPARRSRWPVIAASALSLAAMAALGALGYGFTWPYFHDEAIGFMAVAEVCAHGVRCPLVGPPMLYGIHLGPAFYQVLSIVHLASDARMAFFLLLQAQVAVAVVLLGLAAHRALGGGPWGVVAGGSLYFSEAFRTQLLSPDHATLAILPGAGFVYAALSFSRHRRVRDFVAANLCLGIAVQMYGILFPFIVSLAALGLIGRAPWRAWVLGGLVWLMAFSSWLLFEVRTNAHELTHTFGYENAFTVTGGGFGQLGSSAFDPDLWLLAALGLLYAAVIAARRTTPTGDRRAAVGVLVLGLTALGTCWLGRARWSMHYSLILQLGLSPAFAAAPCAIWRGGVGDLAADRATARRRWIAMPFAAVAILALIGPLARRARSRTLALMTEQTLPVGFVSYAQQDRVGSMLSARGFGPAELERNIHGLHWNAQPGPGWFYDPRSARGVARDRSRHALILMRCAPPRGGFEVIPAPAAALGAMTVALYTPRVLVTSADLDLADGTRLRGPIALPLFSRATNYLFRTPIESREQLGRALPAFRLTPETRRWIAAWQRPARGALVVHATMRPGADERLVVVAHDVRLPVTVRAGGAVVPALDRELTSARNVEHASYRVGNALGDLAIDVSIAHTDGALPADIELYETPFPRCAP